MGERGSVRGQLEALGARALWIAYHDYAGLARAKAVPPERFDDACSRGVTFAKANWDLIITDDQVSHPGFAADSGDFRVVPDPESVVPVPYRPGVVQAYGWLVDDAGPWSGDPRARLADAVATLAAHGLRVRVAFETEFTLFRAGAEGRYELADHGRMFTTDEIQARWPLLERWLDTLAGMGIPVHQLAKEYGPAQYELSLLPADAITATDRFLTARQVIRGLARDAGLVASFMPKPYEAYPGNGLHVHLGLTDLRDADAFGDPGDAAGVTPQGTAAIAGLLDHAQGQAALGSPTPNSYKRLLPGSWAPAHVCWAFGNRAALVRVPGLGEARHIEYRSGDASANPYLHLTGLLAAIVDGLDRDARPPAQTLADVGHFSDQEAAAAGVQRLPLRLEDALDAFARDGVLTAAVGPVITEHYLAVKRFEIESYASLAGMAPDTTEVSDWERATYLEHV